MTDNRVLIVDDDPLALKILERRLTSGGYVVTSATSGQDAMRILCDDPPPLLITDWEMPGMTGPELCRAIRAHEGIGFVYIILLTAYASEECLVTAFDAGADDFLVKPFNYKELLARVRGGERIVSLERNLAKRTREAYSYNAEIEISSRKLEQANEALNRLATTDELTGMTNRRAALARLDEQWAVAVRHGEPLACLMIDIDHFKSVNDTFGHATGDRVLKETATRLCQQVRGGDLACRVGGEEFLVICPLSTAQMAMVGAERLRRAIEGAPIRDGSVELNATVSVGVAERTNAMAKPDDLLRAADEALYAAKRAGRNRVSCAEQNSSHAAEGEPGELGLHPPIRRGETGECERVLIADADGARLATWVDALRAATLEVEAFTDVANAFDALCRAPRGVAVLRGATADKEMLDVVQRIKAAPATSDVPVIVMLDALDERNRGLAFRAGAEEVVEGAIAPSELILRVRGLGRLHRTLRNSQSSDQPRMLTLLLEFSRALSAMDDVESVISQTLAVAVELTGCRQVTVLLINDELRSLVVTQSSNQKLNGARVPIAGSLLGRVLAGRENMVAHHRRHLLTNPAPEEAAFFDQMPIGATVMAASERVVGVLVVQGRLDHQPFQAAEIGVVNLIGNLAGSAIHDLQMRRSRDEARDSIVVALAKLAERRDDDTGKHLDRVTQFCLMLARELQQEPEYQAVIDGRFLADLERAVPLHDIGKVAIPDAILLKPGKLTKEEMAVMRTHSEIGWETLRCVTERVPGARFLKMAEEIAYAHHEWFNGSGYPRGIAGERIPLSARIVALSDVYDAITTRRVYKPALPHDKAVSLIVSSSDSQFDPKVVQAFMRCEKGFAELAAEFAESLPSRAKPTPANGGAATLPLEPAAMTVQPSVSPSMQMPRPRAPVGS